MNKVKISPGVGYALLSAVLFGGSTPFAKILLSDIPPVLLAALLYLGSGIGLFVVMAFRRNPQAQEVKLKVKDMPWLIGALLFGGILGPLLMMTGLQSTPASLASLLLNTESVTTALIAWFIFRENFDKRIAYGMLAIILGALILSYQGTENIHFTYGAIAIVGACICWGIDNNLVQKVSASDPMQIAAIKGLVAGLVNLSVAIYLGVPFPTFGIITPALMVGLLGYGVSIMLFVYALRLLGTARTSAYFSIAPFWGTILSIMMLNEPLSWNLIVAGIFMGIGVWLHLTETHEHEHQHAFLVHNHKHSHDEHHTHDHDYVESAAQYHTHEHVHEQRIHSHPHYPDIHHRHH